MSKNTIRPEDALEYHRKDKPGKIEVIPTKETKSQRDLALAYSPGVAVPCLEIAANVENVYQYTAKGNLVAVISNGTAVLGLGDIGPEASKPVMEGKGILFKIFAGIDVFDIEVNAKDIDHFVTVVKALEPTFGGINLEDIKAPECFYIEERLKREMNIPIMHDDQHGTAIITGAGLLNALEIVGKKIEDVRVVVSGAGASALSCIKIFLELGLRKENLIVCDSKGVVRVDRTDLDEFKQKFATQSDFVRLDDAIVGADVFLGLSKANLMTPQMLLAMAPNPIVFALANPDPEIAYELAVATRDDVVMATGRSDYPNQVNNVLGFPFIFRGALDVRATEINEAMKLAAVRAIAELAKRPVPDVVNMAYNQKNITFGRNYFIPKPLDPRLLTIVAPAVAKAAVESGVAKAPISDWEAYAADLVRRMGTNDNVMRVLTSRAKQSPRRIVFAEAEDYRILKAVQIAIDEGIARPILLGNREHILSIAQEHHLDISEAVIVDPKAPETAMMRQHYGDRFFAKRQRRGYTYHEAHEVMASRNYFGAMMVDCGDADAFISGLSREYSNTIRPALEIIGPYQAGRKISSMYLMLTRRGPLFFADTTVIPEPSAEELADITELTADAVQRTFNITPRIAMLSYSNFGSSNDAEPRRVRKAVELIKSRRPDLQIDGEVQANVAFSPDNLRENYPFSDLVHGEPNVLIFPNLSAANISYKMIQAMNAAEAIGPILLGVRKPVHVLQLGATVREIVNMITLATIDAQNRDNG